MINRIITKGMGASRGQAGNAGLITQGYAGIKLLLELGRRIIRVGQSGTKRRIRDLQSIIVGARLVRVNENRPSMTVIGFVENNHPNMSSRVSIVEHLSTRVRKTWETVTIRIKRLK